MLLLYGIKLSAPNQRMHPTPAASGGGVREDYWGIRRKLMQTATGPEDCYVDFPLAGADSLEKIQAHLWPSVDWFDFEGFADALEPWKDFAIMASGASVLQHPMLLCGRDKVLTDMALETELACSVFVFMVRLTHNTFCRRDHRDRLLRTSGG